ncbi:MAG: hypothetical protein JSC188_000600 [Candidatus Tokpelaia sp. JSC188]|nr:MAG: hypothetical protein JSC188_000600 [Candidatus Tokpelaia sp. JSC188]
MVITINRIGVSADGYVKPEKEKIHGESEDNAFSSDISIGKIITDIFDKIRSFIKEHDCPPNEKELIDILGTNTFNPKVMFALMNAACEAIYGRDERDNKTYLRYH